MFLKGWISEWGKPLFFKIFTQAEQLSCCSAGIHRDVKESKKKNHIWQKSYRTKLSVTKLAQSNALCHPGKVVNAEPNKCQSTPVHAWKWWQWSWSCSYYQLFWATARKPSKAAGWSTFSWCFKPWPVQCSLYSSDNTNMTKQKEKVHVLFNLFFKYEIKMPGINMTYTQHPLQATQTSVLLLSCSTPLFSQSTMSSICSRCIRSSLRGQGQWLLMLLHCAIQPNLGWTALWIRKHTKKHRGA